MTVYMRNKFKILLLVSSLCFLSASDLADSLENRIKNTKGLEQINARLDYSYSLRQSDYATSKEQAKIALKDIRDNYKDKKLLAQGIYHLALPLYYNHEYEEALKYFYEAISISKNADYRFMLCNLYFFVGSINYFYYGDKEQTIKYFNMSIIEGEASNNYRILGAVYASLASIYSRNSSYEKSLEYNYKSRENYKKGNFKEGLAWSSYTMASLYYSIGLLEEAKKLYNEALAEYRILASIDGNPMGVAMCLDQLTILNSELGNDDLARKYNKEALDYYNQNGSNYNSSVALKFKAMLEYNSGNYKNAIALLDSSLTIKKSINDIIGFTSLYESYGKVLIALGDYDAARDSLLIGLKYAKKQDQAKNRIEIDKELATIYKIENNYEYALFFKEKQAAVADSIYSARLTKDMMEMEKLYEIESKENQIMNLKKDNLLKEKSLEREIVIRRLLIFIIISSMIIILLFIYLFLEKQKANKELAKSKQHVDEVNATRDKFFSIIAHDLRAPFSSILGLTNVLITNIDKFDKNKTNEMIVAIQHSTQLSFNLLNNLLEWSRTQTGTISYVPENLDIDSLLESIKELMENNASTKKISIKYQEHGGMIFADMNMLHTILRNLVSNAIKYSKPNDLIEIDYKDEKNSIVFSVKDEGIGISSTNLNRLFRVDDTYYSDGTAGEKGTGLGLIITKEFIEKHDGEIWVESEPGRGSTFWFRIPKK